MTILENSRYNPARGGHAPEDIRKAFLTGLEAMWNGECNPVVELGDQQLPFAQVCGLLWNCSDVLPGSYVSIVQDVVRDLDHQAWSYAAATRALREVIGHSQKHR